MVYSSVFKQREVVPMNRIDVENVQNWLIRMINDPLSKILLENSQLTKIQLETLLIDLLSERVLDKKIDYTAKSSIRLKDKKISRGAFNRTLQQARRNMVRSVMTILLLGYLGALETPSLSPFLEASNKLEIYIQEYEQVRLKVKNNSFSEDLTKSLLILQNNLKNELYNLISPRNAFYIP